MKIHLLKTREILKKFKKYNPSRAILFYAEKQGFLTKMQKVEHGVVKNYYDPVEVRVFLTRPTHRKKHLRRVAYGVPK